MSQLTDTGKLNNKGKLNKNLQVQTTNANSLPGSVASYALTTLGHERLILQVQSTYD